MIKIWLATCLSGFDRVHQADLQANGLCVSGVRGARIRPELSEAVRPVVSSNLSQRFKPEVKLTAGFRTLTAGPKKCVNSED